VLSRTVFLQNLAQVSLSARQLIILLVCIQDLIVDLFVALQTLPAARLLHSQIDGNTRLRANLLNLGSKVGSGEFNIKSTIPLLALVVNNAPDEEIWRAVFDLVAATSPK